MGPHVKNRSNPEDWKKAFMQKYASSYMHYADKNKHHVQNKGNQVSKDASEQKDNDVSARTKPNVAAAPAASDVGMPKAEVADEHTGNAASSRTKPNVVAAADASDVGMPGETIPADS